MSLERRVEKLEAMDAGAPRVTVLLTSQCADADEQERHKRAVEAAEARGEKVFVIELVPASREP
ncbi:MAG: hypothetical protein JNM61_08725 [Zoogloeaceae bacterium]|nr:hypothetical protein [Zoogloeaceae bacterium]